jgi:hypothetical protein
MRTLHTKAAVGIAALSFAAACGHSSHGISSELQIRSRDLTSAAVTDVLAGSSEFTAIQGKLVEALAANPGNHDARLFLGVVSLLDKVQTTLEPGGELESLLTRAGIVDQGPGGSLWSYSPGLENHGQGVFKDTTPTLGELQNWLHSKARPALDGLLTVLEAVPANYEYVIPAAQGGLLLQFLAPGQQIDLRLDYGDVQMAASFVHGMLALLDMGRAVDWDNVAPNDFDWEDDPNLDALEKIRTVYTNLGRLVGPQDLLLARDRLRSSWNCYVRASDHLRGENQMQQEQGILTLGRGTFGDPTQLQEFLQAEAAMRAIGATIVDAFWQDRAVRFDTDPLTGATLPLDQQAEINFFRFFVGVDLRETYFKTVVHPIDGNRRLGVVQLSELTQAMATFGGVLVSVGGVAPTAGDLQELMYTVRVQTPPQSTKTIDGDFSDWQTNAMEVVKTPAAWVKRPCPDLGSIYVAVDANYLYVYLDQDLTPSLYEPGDHYDITCEGPLGEQVISYYNPMGHGSTGPGPMPDYAHNTQGIEMRFPMGTGGTDVWAKLDRMFEAENPTYQVTSDLETIFVKVR